MKKYRFSAFTLPELLVVMILTGILFMAVFDSVDLLRRYSAGICHRLDSGNRLFSGFQTLDRLYRRCDSVLCRDGQFVFFCQGQEFAAMKQEEHLLVVTVQASPDTVFRSVTEVVPAACPQGSRRADSLVVRLDNGGRGMVLLFGITPKYKEDETK